MLIANYEMICQRTSITLGTRREQQFYSIDLFIWVLKIHQTFIGKNESRFFPLVFIVCGILTLTHAWHKVQKTTDTKKYLEDCYNDYYAKAKLLHIKSVNKPDPLSISSVSVKLV